MKLLFASIVVALVHGDGDGDEISLLQHYVSKPINIGAVIHRATSKMPRATDATVAEVDEMIESFLQDLEKTSTALMQVPASQKGALYRRASQSEEVSSFVRGYINLPEETKLKVLNSAMVSEDLINGFQTIPEQDRRALLMQLGSSHMDETVAQKTNTTRTEDAAGNKKTKTVTKDRHGNLIHSHEHVHNAKTGKTETTTNSKNRHVHKHRYNTKGNGKTWSSTETKDKDGLELHTHRHGHDPNSRHTRTETSVSRNGYNGHHQRYHHTHDTQKDGPFDCFLCFGPHCDGCHQSGDVHTKFKNGELTNNGHD